MSYYILHVKNDKNVILTLIPICLGVCFIVFGEISFSYIGLFAVFSANLASASRSIFYKLELSTNSNSTYEIFLNVGFLSFLIYFPLYLVKLIFTRFILCSNLNLIEFNLFKHLSDFSILQPLLYASALNFVYNLFSFQVLSNVSPLTHSILNITKRILIVCFSLVYFSTPITLLQVLGTIIADSGVISYSYFNFKSKLKKPSCSAQSKATVQFLKKLLVGLTILVILTSFFVRFSDTKPNENLKRFQIRREDAIKNQMRYECLYKIKNEILSAFRDVLSSGTRVHLLNLPFHNNYGDTLIW